MIAFVFPGQGAQQVGMGRSLAEQFEICRETFEEADAALGESLSGSPSASSASMNVCLQMSN